MDENIITRLERLERAVFADEKVAVKTPKKNREKIKNPQLEFSLNVRAFAKRFVANKSGPKKFVLLLAYLAKGEVGKCIAVSDILKEWKKMSAKNLLGKFNRFYSNEAKTQGWVDSRKYGFYCLANDWKEAYEQ